MKAEKQVRELYDRFIELYPKSTDEFVVTFENIARWHYMIEQAKNRNQYPDFAMPDISKTDAAERLAKSRAVGVFDRLPKGTKNKYLKLAALFPGREIFACGSRISGHWIDKGSGPDIVKMRETLLRKQTTQSDYDITITPKEGDDYLQMRSIIPSWADLVLRLGNGEPKILIPMWNFDKLPKSEHKRVIELYSRQQWGALMDIHNQYGLSDASFCCDYKPAKSWFGWAIENGIITETE